MSGGYRRLDPKTMEERDDLIMKLVEQRVHYEEVGRQVHLGRVGVCMVVRKRRKRAKDAGMRS